MHEPHTTSALRQPQLVADQLPEVIEGTFTFPADDPVYAEHFPGAPCVPGSLLIQAFVTAARLHGVAGSLAVRGFRFRKFVAPAAYPYIMRLHPDNKSYQCTLTADGTRAVTGTLLCS